MNIICHIAGPSGSGKTTLLKKINELFPTIITKDLDEFDDEASRVLGLDSTKKKEWDNDDFKKLAQLRQKLMDDFIASQNNRPIVLGGFHTEDEFVLHIPTDSRFLLDVSAEESANRAYLRSRTEDAKFRRSIDDMSFDIAEAQKEIDFLVRNNYKKMSADEIMEFIKTRIIVI